MNYSKLVEPIKTYNRWPVKHKKQEYPDRLSLLMHFSKINEEDMESKMNLFPHSRVYFVRAALEAKFNRHFSQREVVHIINDKSWQRA